jgi:hypothetical protein
VRRRWWHQGSGTREAAGALAAYGCYLLVKRRVWNDRGRAAARRNATLFVEWEERVGVHVEPQVQRLALRAPRLVDVLNAGYAVGNVGLTVGWLIWLHRRGDPAFARERRAALAVFLGALPAFALVPTAPPRTLDGFVDTLAERGMSIDRPFLVRFYNPIAAMPSMHLGFAVATGFGLALRARGPWRRRAWRAYPAAVALVVLGTANHFVIDVAAGAALGAAARAVTRGRRGS